MAWVDYKKAHDMVPHSWITESLKMAQVAENIITCLQKSTVNWKAGRRYEQKPDGVVESENFKILWDFTVQCDRKIEARRPHIVFIDKKEREVVIIDVAIPSDDRVKDKEL